MSWTSEISGQWNGRQRPEGPRASLLLHKYLGTSGKALERFGDGAVQRSGKPPLRADGCLISFDILSWKQRKGLSVTESRSKYPRSPVWKEDFKQKPQRLVINVRSMKPQPLLCQDRDFFFFSIRRVFNVHLVTIIYAESGTVNLLELPKILNLHYFSCVYVVLQDRGWELPFGP